jgi:tetratricopeptide (TPR) repeat protein
VKPPLFASPEARRLFWLCGALLLLAALALNLRVVDFGFLYLRDDDVNVTVNQHMGGLTLARLHWMFTDSSFVRRYIPLGWLGFSATYEFAGLHPAPYHLVGLLLYGLDAVLVFAVVVHVLRTFAPGEAAGVRPWAVGAAALAAGWWAFHPFRVETTAWVSGNLYGQAMALLLAGLLAYLRSYGAAGGRRAALLGLAAAAYAASLLTYPIALGVPVLLAGLDWLWARAHPGTSLRRLLLEKLLFAVPLAGVLAITVAARFAGAAVFGTVPGITELPLLDRVAQSAYIAAYYVWKPWWPLHLSPLYDTLVDFRPGDPIFALSMAAVAAASVAALWQVRRRPALAVVWFGYLAVAAPYFGLTEKPHMASDRYGAFLTVITASLLALGLARLAGRPARLAATLAALAVVAALGGLTSRQLGYWRNDRVHHEYVASQLHPGELLDFLTSRGEIVEFMRGNEQAAEAAVAEGLRRNPASAGYRQAAQIIAEKEQVRPYFGSISFLAIIQDQTGLALARLGEYREANDHLEDALGLSDQFYQAAYDRALVLLHLGRTGEALGSFYLAERWAHPALTTAQRNGFLDQLARAAADQGNAVLAARARAAMGP